MRFSYSILVSILIVSVSFSQVDWRKMLKQDIVQIINGKMLLEEYYIINGVDDTGAATSIQMKIYSEASAGGFISRDNFVMLTTLVYLPVILEVGEFEEIEEPIGKCDWEFSIFMSSGGIQFELLDNNLGAAIVRETMTWESMFNQ